MISSNYVDDDLILGLPIERGVDYYSIILSCTSNQNFATYYNSFILSRKPVCVWLNLLTIELFPVGTCCCI